MSAWNDRRVLIGLPNGNLGGMQVQTCSLARALVGGGYDVTIACYRNAEPAVVAMLEQSGARVIALKCLRRRRLFPGLALLWEFGDLIRSLRPFFVHLQCMDIHLMSPPLWASRLCRVPCILATNHFTARHVRDIRRMRRTITPMCDAVICVSKSSEESFFGDSRLFEPALLSGGRRHFTICNGIDAAAAEALAATNPGPDIRARYGIADRPLVGIVGRLRPVKGYELLLPAMARVVREMPDVRLLAVGGNSHKERFATLAKELGIEDRVTWAGELPPAETSRCLCAFDVLAAPSKREGLSLAAAEAMALGKPVVATDVPGLRDLVAHETTGLLVPPENPAALAEAILALLSDPSRRIRMGQEGRRRIEERFSMKLYARKHLALYEAMGTKR